MHAHIDGKRIRLVSKDGKHLFYDIDADDKVYWLRIRRDNKLQRYRVRDHQLAEEIRLVAIRAIEERESGTS